MFLHPNPALATAVACEGEATPTRRRVCVRAVEPRQPRPAADRRRRGATAAVAPSIRGHGTAPPTAPPTG
eukprot:scaffold84360_cov48-Phaeocystis_antarctica.AAC.1